ncbi:MAG: NADH-quinone oxidoreductase subunit NuoE [Phycisphaerales bacterium]|nr:NADH-quinone oxidoreductase subunit NuoE [Phycisphaerales bacterium]
MSWKVIDRNAAPDKAEAPVLTDALVEKIRVFLPRYETKRAALLPALHVVQDHFGYVSWQAMQELAELLEINASDVFDVVTFYTYFWTHPRGEKVVTVCRSTACAFMGADSVLDECKKVLGIGEHETTADGKFSLQTEECLATCDHAPCLYVNERCHKHVKPEDVRRIIEDPNNAKLDIERSTLFDGVKGA